MMYGDHMDAGGWILSGFMTLLVVGLVVFLLIWLLDRRPVESPPRPEGRDRSAREVLDQRLVTGEIGEEEYRRIRATLSETPEPPRTGEPASSGAG